MYNLLHTFNTLFLYNTCYKYLYSKNIGNEVQLMRNLVIFFVIIFAIAGCSNADKKQSDPSAESIEPLDVEVTIYPSPIEINQEVTFEAAVTQGNDKVVDAKSIEFEIWKNDEENHEKVKGELQKEGVYIAKKTFKEAGTYQVIAHVTARDMHTMPQREFDVVDLKQQGETEPQPAAEADHHHGSELLIHFVSDTALNANEQTELMAHVSYKDAPLQGARVRYEVWLEGETNHEYIDAAENKNGEYSAMKTFDKPGLYNIKVHVEEETNKLHDHKLEKVTIQ